MQLFRRYEAEQKRALKQKAAAVKPTLEAYPVRADRDLSGPGSRRRIMFRDGVDSNYTLFELMRDREQLLCAREEDGDIEIRSFKNGKRLGRISGHGAAVILIKEYKEHLVTADQAHCIRVWNKFDFSCMAVLQGHEETVVDMIPYQGKLVSLDAAGHLKLWDVAQQRCESMFQHELIRADHLHVMDAATEEPKLTLMCARGRTFYFETIDFETKSTQFLRKTRFLTSNSRHAHILYEEKFERFVSYVLFEGFMKGCEFTTLDLNQPPEMSIQTLEPMMDDNNIKFDLGIYRIAPLYDGNVVYWEGFRDPTDTVGMFVEIHTFPEKELVSANFKASGDIEVITRRGFSCH